MIDRRLLAVDRVEADVMSISTDIGRCSCSADSSLSEEDSTLEVCRTAQSMIDIAAKQLFGLRICGTSEELIQKEICECESKLIRLFSKMLVAKSKLVLTRRCPSLDVYPNTDQWLQIVGISNPAVAKKISSRYSVIDMLKLPSAEIHSYATSCGVTDDDARRLSSSLHNLRHCMEHGGKLSPDIDLHWSAYKASMPLGLSSIGNSPKFSHHRPSTSSLPPVDTTLSPPSPHHSDDDDDIVAPATVPQSPFSYSSPATEPRRRSTPPPTPPLVKPGAKGARFTRTPPPQRKNKLHLETFPQLTKSKSHESQLAVKVNQDVDLSKYLKKKPTDLVLNDPALQKRSMASTTDEFGSRSVASGQSSPCLTSPFRTAPRSPADFGSERKGNQLEVPASSLMMHSIKHKFQKKIVMGACDYCRRHTFRGKVCKYCKAKFHHDCASKAPPSCGLPEELLNILVDSLHESATSRLNHSLGDQMGPDSSSATSSCNSSTPSSPAFGSFVCPNSSSPSGYHSRGSDHSVAQQPAFQFPDCNPAAFDSIDGSMGCSTYGSSQTSGIVDVLNTNTSNDSDKSDKTLIDTGSSSERSGYPMDRIESIDSGEDLQGLPLERVNSISVALRKWNIPYSELIFGEKIGPGRFGTVYKGSWHGDVAIKELYLESTSDPDNNAEDQLEAFKHEVATLTKTRHENLVLFMGACMTPPKLAIVTSLCKGLTLFTLLHKRKERFQTSRMVSIASQIAQGMGYLHAKGIVHKDLKSKNIFLESGTQASKVVITDFGLFSVTKLCQGSRKGSWLSIPPGWLCYLPPEVMVHLRADNQERRDLPFSNASDVYSFGTIWYELLCGEWPFKKQPPEAIIWQVGKGMKQSLTSIQASRDVKDVLMQCWAYKPTERPDFKEILVILDKLPKKRLARSPSHPIQLSRSAESVF